MKRFIELRGALAAKDIDQRYLGERLGVSAGYISARMTAKVPWDMEEVYTILDLINRPPEDIPVLFPKNGMRYEKRDPVRPRTMRLVR